MYSETKRRDTGVGEWSGLWNEQDILSRGFQTFYGTIIKFFLNFGDHLNTNDYI